MRSSVYPEEVLLEAVIGVATMLLQDKKISPEIFRVFVSRVIESPYFNDPGLTKQVKKAGKMLVRGWVNLQNVADQIIESV